MGFRLKFVPLQVQIDFLRPKAKRLAPCAEDFQSHPQNLGIERDAGFGMGGGENKVVEVVNHEGVLVVRSGDVGEQGSKRHPQRAGRQAVMLAKAHCKARGRRVAAIRCNLANGAGGGLQPVQCQP